MPVYLWKTVPEYCSPEGGHPKAELLKTSSSCMDGAIPAYGECPEAETEITMVSKLGWAGVQVFLGDYLYGRYPVKATCGDLEETVNFSTYGFSWCSWAHSPEADLVVNSSSLVDHVRGISSTRFRAPHAEDGEAPAPPKSPIRVKYYALIENDQVEDVSFWLDGYYVESYDCGSTGAIEKCSVGASVMASGKPGIKPDTFKVMVNDEALPSGAVDVNSDQLTYDYPLSTAPKKNVLKIYSKADLQYCLLPNGNFDEKSIESLTGAIATRWVVDVEWEDQGCFVIDHEGCAAEDAAFQFHPSFLKIMRPLPQRFTSMKTACCSPTAMWIFPAGAFSPSPEGAQFDPEKTYTAEVVPEPGHGQRNQIPAPYARSRVPGRRIVPPRTLPLFPKITPRSIPKPI